MSQYSRNTKVAHINEIAQVGSLMVQTAKKEGRSWWLRSIPPGKGNIVQVAGKRLLDLELWSRQQRLADLVHIHYAPNGYYGWGSKTPFVLHFHGTDAREDFNSPYLGPLIRHSLKKAAAVAYSTPDLKKIVSEWRSDAVYLPNPVPLSYINGLSPDLIQQKRVVFNARWDDSKGGMKLVSAAQRLVSKGIEVVGLDWGIYAAEAKKSGVQLFPLMDMKTFSYFIASGDVVVGQQSFGSLGMTDLQTMALGRPLVIHLNDTSVPVAHSEADNVAEVVLELLKQPEKSRKLAVQAEDWILRNHHPVKCLSVYEDLYRKIL